MTPVISLVTGTYNRLQLLREMVESFRRQIPRHLPYEVVVVDGGSDDGTQDWLRQQPDVVPVFHHALLGGIRAFCDGARAAAGEYVLLANDDIRFRGYGVLRALAHLEDTPLCGAVAFADDRASQLGHGRGHQVLKMHAVEEGGKRRVVNYAQVGLFRRSLGDAAGWWGDRDPVMSAARTYGGDNYLSSRIWEMGYTVDDLPECTVDDVIAADRMHRINNDTGRKDSAIYYSRYPHGALIPAAPMRPHAYRRKLRILVCPIYEPGYPARLNLEYGLSEALAATGLTFEVDYANERVDWAELVRCFRPHLILTQFHDAKNWITGAHIDEARRLSPGVVCVNWNGDAHESGLIAPDVLRLLRHFDLQLVVNAKVLPAYGAAGIRADYWQIGYKDPVGDLPVMPAHDVVCLMNCYNDQRVAMAAALKGTGLNVGLYGSCKGADGNTHYSFGAGRALYRGAKVAVGDTFPGTEGFVSNRLLQALSAGVLLLQQRSDRLEEFTGLVPGQHYVEWTDLADLTEKVRLWTSDAKAAERDIIRAAGRDFVRQNFSYDAQVAKLWGLLPR